MRELIDEGRALLQQEWQNKKNPDGTYDVTFDDGREFKGVVWRSVSGHRVIVTKKGKMVGFPDEVSKAVAGDKDAPLDATKPAKSDEKNQEEPKDEPEKKARRQKAKERESEVLKTVEGMKPSKALKHLEGVQAEGGLPATEESAKGQGLFGKIAGMVTGFVKGAAKALKAAVGAKVERAKHKRNHKKKLEQLKRSRTLMQQHLSALEKEFGDEAKPAQERARTVTSDVEKGLSSASKMRRALKRLKNEDPEKKVAKHLAAKRARSIEKKTAALTKRLDQLVAT